MSLWGKREERGMRDKRRCHACDDGHDGDDPCWRGTHLCGTREVMGMVIPICSSTGGISGTNTPARMPALRWWWWCAPMLVPACARAAGKACEGGGLPRRTPGQLARSRCHHQSSPLLQNVRTLTPTHLEAYTRAKICTEVHTRKQMNKHMYTHSHMHANTHT